MAQLIAPYNNSMRLGQGFNSYTHQICLHNAVTVPPTNRTPADSPGGSTAPGTSEDWMYFDTHNVEGTDSESQAATGSRHGDQSEKAQIVTYSTRFVEKISEVVDSMNISAALTINTATVGGAANGQYIDSDKFKQSDINYFVQVRVTNQRLDAKPQAHLNLVNSVKTILAPGDSGGEGGAKAKPGGIDMDKFRDVYGDCFISGWEEGGELNALISVKCKNTAKAKTIKAHIEGHLGTPALSGKVEGTVDINNASTFSESETTITVNWSGGGRIKEENVLWDINSLTLAAANFPDRVMKTPQKTYALLTRYTELPDFQNQIPNYTALDYDLAGVYTYALLDMYTDYKAIWKQLQIASSDVEARRIHLEAARLSTETTTYLDEYRPYALDDVTTTGRLAIQVGAISAEQAVSAGATSAATADTQVSAPRAQKGVQQYKPYSASLIGLQLAKTDCRLQMLKIVREVDSLKANPGLAVQGDAANILPPAIYRQLLPVAVPLPDIQSEEWATELGTSFSPEHPLSTAHFEKFPAAQKSALANADKSKTYRMSTWAGPPIPGQGSNFIFQNDLDKLDKGLIVDSIRIYYVQAGITGITIFYTNRVRVLHGSLQFDKKDCQSKEFFADGRTILSAQFAADSTRAAATDSENFSIIHGSFNYSNLETLSVSCGRYKPSSRQVMTTTAPSMKNEQWDLSGFYSNFNSSSGLIECLGVIWGSDVGRPEMTILPPHVDISYFPAALQQNIKDHIGDYDQYRLSDFAGSFDFSTGPDIFFDIGKQPLNALCKSFTCIYAMFEDTWCLCGIECEWIGMTTQPPKIGAGSGVNNTGLVRKRHPIYNADGLRMIGMTVVTGKAKGQDFVSEVHFHFAQPPFSTYTISTTWDGAVPENKPQPKTVGKVLRITPPPGKGWGIIGFYGQSGVVIDRLGAVWGRDRSTK